MMHAKKKKKTSYKGGGKMKMYDNGGKAPRRMTPKGPKKIKLKSHTDKDESKFKSDMKRQYLASGAFKGDKSKGTPVQKANRFSADASKMKFKGSVNKQGIQKSKSNVGAGVSPSSKRRRR